MERSLLCVFIVAMFVDHCGDILFGFKAVCFGEARKGIPRLLYSQHGWVGKNVLTINLDKCHFIAVL